MAKTTPYPKLDWAYQRLRGPKARSKFIRDHPQWAKAAGLTVKGGKITKPAPRTRKRRDVTVGGQSYTVNPKTGVVRDASGQIVIGATYDPKTGAVTVGGQVADLTPKRTPIAGQTYERNFTNTKVWTTAVDQNSGQTYYVNKRNGNVFTTDGVYAGTHKDGKFEFFDLPAGTGEGTIPGAEPPEDAPPKPTSPLPEGWDWGWDEESESWVPMEGEAPEEDFDNDLMAYVTDLLSQYGLDTPGLLDFAKTAISQGWSSSQIMLELRKHPDYLANPLFAANVQRAKAGGGWMAEGQIIAYANETKRLAKQYGYGEPSDNYIAQNIQGGRSLAEFEHRVQIQRNVENYGPAVRMLMEDYLGHPFEDDDLYELFDPEIDTEEWSRAFKDAMYRGRPFALGLGVRSQAEADALRLLGVDPDEAFGRYSQVAQNATRFDRLASIEDMVAGKLPDNFGDFSKAPNSLLVRALVFQDSAALAELQQMTAREIGRFNTGGGFASAQGQAIGALTAAEKATFG